MTRPDTGTGKLPGKTTYAGRRRDTTRRSGFKVHPDTTGGEFRRDRARTYRLSRAETVQLTFRISGHVKGDLVGYGAWFWHSGGVVAAKHGGPEAHTLTAYEQLSWNKVGSIWAVVDGDTVETTFVLLALRSAEVAVYEPACGRVTHRHLRAARPELLGNMYQFSPEAIFVDPALRGEISLRAPRDAPTGSVEIVLKSCNRCGRYLPVNVPTERDQLSFSNHCVADHRRPCRHATFGRLRNVSDPSDELRLDYGFQLECRYCKKFEVNAAHNPQRTTAQMKEDGARRRAFELLLGELYGGTPQLKYRRDHGGELADDVWERFDRRCFNCGVELPTARDMHLDHTRPLALLWPLDGSATALCGPCNSEKRDRSPGDFYPPGKLARLARITGIGLTELRTARPNDEAIKLLLSKLPWFFGDFLEREEMTRERDGKVTGDLVVKALRKVLARSPHYRGVDLVEAYEKGRPRRRP